MTGPRMIPADEARELQEAATPGPWTRSESAWEPHSVRTHNQLRWVGMTGEGDEGVDANMLADALLFAAAPDLAYTVEQQAAKIARLQAAVYAAEDYDRPWAVEELIADGIITEEDMQ